MVFENARVTGGAHIFHNAKIYGNALVDNYAFIHGHTCVFDNAHVSYLCFLVSGNYGMDAEIKSEHERFSITSIISSNDELTFYKGRNNEIMVHYRDFLTYPGNNGCCTLEEFEKWVDATYYENTNPIINTCGPHPRKYKLFINAIEMAKLRIRVNKCDEMFNH